VEFLEAGQKFSNSYVPFVSKMAGEKIGIVTPHPNKNQPLAWVVFTIWTACPNISQSGPFVKQISSTYISRRLSHLVPNLARSVIPF
jgi:hypothetical protein